RLFKLLLPFALEAGLKNSQAPKNIALKAVAGVMGLIASIFALITLHQYLSSFLKPMEVNGCFAIGFIVLAVLLWLIAYIRSKRKKPASSLLPDLSGAPTGLRNFVEQSATNVIHAKQKFDRATRNNTGKILLGAAVFGLLMGSRARGKRRSKED
ncbi:hypothetical protein, partial [Suttonella ornithocola]